MAHWESAFNLSVLRISDLAELTLDFVGSESYKKKQHGKVAYKLKELWRLLRNMWTQTSLKFDQFDLPWQMQLLDYFIFFGLACLIWFCFLVVSGLWWWKLPGKTYYSILTSLHWMFVYIFVLYTQIEIMSKFKVNLVQNCNENFL